MWSDMLKNFSFVLIFVLVIEVCANDDGLLQDTNAIIEFPDGVNINETEGKWMPVPLTDEIKIKFAKYAQVAIAKMIDQKHPIVVDVKNIRKRMDHKGIVIYKFGVKIVREAHGFSHWKFTVKQNTKPDADTVVIEFLLDTKSSLFDEDFHLDA